MHVPRTYLTCVTYTSVLIIIDHEMNRTLFQFNFTTNREFDNEDNEDNVDGDSESESDSNQTDGPSRSKKTKVKKMFQTAWLAKWPWLRKVEKGMQCNVCLDQKKANTFTGSSGCENYRTSTLKRHAESSDHRDSLRAEALQKDFDKAAQTARKDVDKSIESAMINVFWMAKEDIPIKKYSSMCNFLKVQECQKIEHLSVSNNATYTSRSSGEEFQACVAEAIHRDIIEKIKNAHMFSVLVDESTDISISKQMVVYVRVVDPEFNPRTYFLENITIDNTKSDAAVLFQAIEKCLGDKGLNIDQVKGFGSDGASVMVGRHSGVATRVKQKSPHCISIHCMAHRFNLATSQASKNITFMKDFEKTLSDLYYYFGGSKSGNRKCELQEIQKVLDDPQVKIKECHEIRWIAFSEAVFAVYRSWSSLVTYFRRHDDSKCKSFRAKLTDYKFVSVLHLLMDILPSVAQMSMVLQKQDIDIAAVKPAFDGLKDKIKLAKRRKSHYQCELQEKLQMKENVPKYKGNNLTVGSNLKDTSKQLETIRHEFCDTMIKNIEDRFPKEALTVASAFHIFGMRPLSFMSEEDREAFGEKEMEILLEHYGKEITKEGVTSPPMVNPVKCKEEFQLAKKIVLEQMYPRDNTKLLLKLLFTYHKETLPNLVVLANLCLIMPFQTADCERGFSCQNGIKTSRRNRMNAEHLNILMTIKIEGGKVEDYDFSSAIKIWKGKKQRRICSK